MINGKVLLWTIGLGMAAALAVFPYLFRSDDSRAAALKQQYGVAQIKGFRHFSSQELTDASSSLKSINPVVANGERAAVIVRVNPSQAAGVNCPSFWGPCWTALIVFADGSHAVLNAYGSNLDYFSQCFQEADRIVIDWGKVDSGRAYNIGSTQWVRNLDPSQRCRQAMR